MSAAARATNFCRTESPLGTYTGPEGCLHRSQASHLSRRSSADQSSKSGEMGKGEKAENGLVIYLMIVSAFSICVAKSRSE